MFDKYLTGYGGDRSTVTLVLYKSVQSLLERKDLSQDVRSSLHKVRQSKMVSKRQADMSININIQPSVADFTAKQVKLLINIYYTHTHTTPHTHTQNTLM